MPTEKGPQLVLDDFDQLAESWELSLTAARKSPKTIRIYRAGVRKLTAWCRAEGREAVEFSTRVMDAWVAAMLEAGELQPASVAKYHQGVRMYAKWLRDEGEIESNPIEHHKGPRVDELLVAPLDDDEVAALLAACEGRGFTDRRDKAIVRMMLVSTARCEDLLSMRISTTMVKKGVATLTGKGSKQRLVPFDPTTAAALDSYLRARRTHALASSDKFWLGTNNRGFGYQALYEALRRRARTAGIERFHPHLTRHTSAAKWLERGGSESGLMSVAGWDDPASLRRYTKYASNKRAIEEAHRIGHGDF